MHRLIQPSRFGFQVGRNMVGFSVLPTQKLSPMATSIFKLNTQQTFLKTKPFSTQETVLLKFLHHEVNLPKGRVSEDASYAHSTSLGIADGVGGYREYGIDPGHFSRNLMKTAKEFSKNCIDPYRILEHAIQQTREAKIQGGSTMLVVTLEGGLLRTANLGDSGFLVFRGNSLVYQSKPLLKGWNTPFQFAFEEQYSNHPEDAELKYVKVQGGDLVVLYTDGVTDNLENDEILELLKQPTAEKDLMKRCESYAEGIANLAKHYSKGVANHKRKPDDISVVCGIVVPAVEVVPKAKL
jgi:protein phosphatase PTC7